jgi:phage-related protein
MTENKGNNAKEQFTIRMIGVQQGASQEKLIAGLQRLYKQKTPEEIQKALNRLPLVLSRSAKKTQALKIKEFLESAGAFIELTDTSPVKGREDPREGKAEVVDGRLPLWMTDRPQAKNAGQNRVSMPAYNSIPWVLENSLTDHFGLYASISGCSSLSF